jgi:Protein of unknown function (DUF1592)/Protein of unknown function (DUF1588)/Protein of unknown function (DUF1595)/Protein of unknown function (DUF1585)/Protein of unknown function (DUF1587)
MPFALLACSGQVNVADGYGEPGPDGTGATGPNGTNGPITSPSQPPVGVSGSPTGNIVVPAATASDGTIVPPVFSPAAFDFDGEPTYSRAIQLTNAQWAHAVKDVLKLPELPTQSNSFLNPVGGFTDFVNNERVLEVTNDLRESFQLAAAEIAKDSASTAAAISRIAAGNDAATFIDTLGRRAFRRVLTTEEKARYQTLFDTGSELSGSETAFVKGAGVVVEAMIQDPNFLYRTELAPTGQPLTSFEVAAKLSFWLRGTTPDDTLLDKAESNQFDTAEAVAQLAETMLAEPGAMEMAVNMHAELFKFSRYRNIINGSPDWDPEVNAELEEVSRSYFEDVFTSGKGLTDILTSTSGFVGPKTAELYGITPAPANVTQKDLGPERPGFFAQVPYLMLFGNDAHSDAIHRGVNLNFDILCAKIELPEVVPPLKEQQPGQTDRVRIEVNTGVGTCGQSCHGAYINPLGYAFENFDGLGRVRTTDNGFPVDTKASYPFSDGVKSFDGAKELMDLIVASPEAHACYAKHIMSYGLQRDVIVDDKPLVDTLTDISMAPDGSIKKMIIELVKSPTFRTHSGGAQ